MTNEKHYLLYVKIDTYPLKDSIEPFAHTSPNIASKFISSKEFEKIKSDVRKLSSENGIALGIVAKAERVLFVLKEVILNIDEDRFRYKYLTAFAGVIHGQDAKGVDINAGDDRSDDKAVEDVNVHENANAMECTMYSSIISCKDVISGMNIRGTHFNSPQRLEKSNASKRMDNMQEV